MLWKDIYTNNRTILITWPYEQFEYYSTIADNIIGFLVASLDFSHCDGRRCSVLRRNETFDLKGQRALYNFIEAEFDVIAYSYQCKHLKQWKVIQYK